MTRELIHDSLPNGPPQSGEKSLLVNGTQDSITTNLLDRENVLPIFFPAIYNVDHNSLSFAPGFICSSAVYFG